jgi:cytochrome c oxidase cbb3-type subunit 2
MPSYSWLFTNKLDGGLTATKMKMLNIVIGATCPKCNLYTEEEMAKAQKDVAGKTEAEAVVAYLQGLGTNLK